MQSTFKVRSVTGVEFTALLIRVGDRYGRDDSLVNEKVPLVEFHWPPKSGTGLGSPVFGQCFASDFVGRTTPYKLYGDEPDTTIGVEELSRLAEWLKGELGMSG